MPTELEGILVARACPGIEKGCVVYECGMCPLGFELVDEFDERIVSDGGELADEEHITGPDFISTWGFIYRENTWLVRMSIIRGIAKGQAEPLNTLNR
jgi:hypothetical protein